MKYFERCKKRIENAKKIDWDFSSTFNYTERFIIDEVLIIRKICEVDSNHLYSIDYKKIIIPMSEEELITLFKLAHDKCEELEDIKDKEILEEL